MKSSMIGIVTFHGSHNHGSMLQAYATQQAISSLGYSCEIINFRMQSQKEYYALYQTKYGKMRFFRGLLLAPIHYTRKKCASKFEEFLSTMYTLSGEELQTYKDLEKICDKYDIYLSGSDQIWSGHIPEFKESKVDYTGVYFLDFVAPDKRKISYASSTGTATLEELEQKKSLLEQYSFISVRESSGAACLNKFLDSHVSVMPDPTLLLSGEQWREIERKKPLVNGKYIFLYTLGGIRPGLMWARYLTKLGCKFGLKVVCVAPFFPIAFPGVTCLVNVGPKDFINLIDNAELIITDSFHGTAFSINLEKPFYSLSLPQRKDERKINLMNQLELGERNLLSYSDIEKITDYSLDYTFQRKKLRELRNLGYNYLMNALSERN